MFFVFFVPPERLRCDRRLKLDQMVADSYKDNLQSKSACNAIAQPFQQATYTPPRHK